MTPEILAIRPVPEWTGRRTIAFVDLQLTPDCKLLNLKLVDGINGRRVHAASAFGNNTAKFSPALGNEIVRLANLALGDIARNERHREAN